MNLPTARSAKRQKEVGVRKVAGALKQSLIGQFLGESILIALIAGIIATILVELILLHLIRSWNSIDDRLQNIYFWFAGIGFVLFTEFCRQLSSVLFIIV